MDGLRGRKASGHSNSRNPAGRSAQSLLPLLSAEEVPSSRRFLHGRGRGTNEAALRFPRANGQSGAPAWIGLDFIGIGRCAGGVLAKLEGLAEAHMAMFAEVNPLPSTAGWAARRHFAANSTLIAIGALPTMRWQ
jgi:hypothetical protein